MSTLSLRMLIGALMLLLSSVAVKAAEPLRIVVGYQPYDTISYSAVVIRALELWKKYLPRKGTEVVFQDAMQGPIIVKRLQAGTEQIGYLGDMPAVVVSAQRDIAKINLVATTGYSQGQRCGIVLVRADAPEFKSSQEAMAWLSGKRIATPRGTCSDHFLRTLINKHIVEPAEVRHHSLEVIATKLHAHEIDAAVLWEYDGVAHPFAGRRRHPGHIVTNWLLIRHVRCRRVSNARGLHAAASGKPPPAGSRLSWRRNCCSTRRISLRWPALCGIRRLG